MKGIAIVGGGIAGLNAAYHLQRARAQTKEISYTLFEKSSRLGGALHSEHVDGCLVEAGADSFLTEKPWALELCRELGIEGELIGSNDRQRKTWVAAEGKLHPLPEGLQFVVPGSLAGVKASDLFSAEGKRRIAAEREFVAPDIEKKSDKEKDDESAGAFLRRHFGPELVERIADPMFAGIYGVKADRLSARTVLPKFLEMERKHGSLILALESQNVGNAKAQQPIFTSFREGMQTLVDAVVAKLDSASIRLKHEIQSVKWEGGCWRFAGQASAECFDGLVLALPAPVAGKLLQQDSPELATRLESIPYTSSATVALGYDPAAVRKQKSLLPGGFGFLFSQAGSTKEAAVEAEENMLACTFVNQKFAPRAPAGWALLRCFFGSEEGGGTFRSDDELVAAARQRLAKLLGWTAEPAFTRVYRWPGAMPVYELGHLEKVQQIQELCRQRPGLGLIGNAYSGIGIPDCIRQGKEIVQRILAVAPTTQAQSSG